MILRQLFSSKKGDVAEFSGLQANESIRWLATQGVTSATHPTALDLGCGFGFFGHALTKAGFSTVLSDDSDMRHPSLPRDHQFKRFDLCADDFSMLGSYHLVVCSNVLEHLPKPELLLRHFPTLLKPGGVFYLSWTNWLSPYGGHEYAPYHFAGAKVANWLYQHVPERMLIDGRQKQHTLGRDLFPTYIGRILRTLKNTPNVEVLDYVPRYYSEWRWIVHTPILREFLTWNFAVLVRRSR